MKSIRALSVLYRGGHTRVAVAWRFALQIGLLTLTLAPPVTQLSLRP